MKIEFIKHPMGCDLEEKPGIGGVYSKVSC